MRFHVSAKSITLTAQVSPSACFGGSVSPGENDVWYALSVPVWPVDAELPQSTGVLLNLGELV